MTNDPQHLRVLGIAPSSRGFGFAVLEDGVLVDWGLKLVSGDKNVQCLVKVESIVTQYQPDVLVLEDFQHTRRGSRIRLLIQAVIDLAQKHNVGVKLFSREQIHQLLIQDGERTKNGLALVLANRFPDELGMKLPPRRQPWKSEDYRMAVFDAVAFGLMVL